MCAWLEKLFVVMEDLGRNLADTVAGMALVGAPAEVDVIARALAAAPLAAFDLEFASADRLVPVLCLVQVAWVDDLDAPPEQLVPEVRLVDPLGVDVAPIVRALAEHPLVVAHAPRQDLGLLATRFGTGMRGLFDTQLAAAFVGLGDQVGLATLASELVGAKLAKEQQWTAWEKRPLTDAQLAYAEADVSYLPELYAKLAKRLGARVAWVREESAQVVVDARQASSVTPETAWRSIGGTRGLDARSRGAVAALAAWRLRTALELDRPLGQVLADKLLVELARTRPDSAAIRSWKGLSPHARTRAEAIAGELETADALAGEAPRTTSMRALRWAEMLVAIVQLVADDTGIAPRLLATRADAEDLARAFDEGGMNAAAALPAFATWRREVLGTAWEGWLTGRVALVGDPTARHGVRLVPR
jgi:ribonuclease D